MKDLPSVPASIDSANFVLGLDEYDVSDHRPHPPGYPVYMAMGRASNVLAREVWTDDTIRTRASALSMLGAVFGALAVIPLFIVLRSIEGNERRALAAAALTLACPLFWFTAYRPLSDIPGLAAALTVQAAILYACGHRSQDGHRSQYLWMSAAAAMAGVSIGVRFQNTWLTVPPLLWAAAHCRLGTPQLARLAVMFLGGVLAWAVPMLMFTGGLDSYARAVAAQGSDDMGAGTLLATNFTGESLGTAFVYTFAYPWAEPALAIGVAAFAVVGAAAMWRRSPSGLAWLVWLWVPYGVFHLLFQESFHTRYALPLIPAVAYLAIRGLDAVSTRGMPYLVAPVLIAGVFIASTHASSLARNGSPVFRALEDIERAAPASSTRPVVSMHHAVSRLVRATRLNVQALIPQTPSYEWLDLVDHWKKAPHTPIWFLAENGRADLALFDPRARREVRSYAWGFQQKLLMGRVPSTSIGWYELQPPGWMLGRGWSLSHESAGNAARDGSIAGRSRTAYVRSRPEGAILLLGGRLTGAGGESEVRLALKIGGRAFDAWNVRAASGGFLRMWRLPPGTLDAIEPYLALEVVAQPGKDSAASVLALEQFDVQSDREIVFGFDAGWYQPEFDGAAPRPWRWTAGSAKIRVHAPNRDLRLRLRIEVPHLQLGAFPEIRVSAGPRVLARARPRHARLALDVPIPGQALAESGGVITLHTDRTFEPGRVLGNNDTRELGLRVYEVDVLDHQPAPN